MNEALSYRDALAARKVQWAQSKNLHPNAVEYARKYLNLDSVMLKLISDYEYAADLSEDDLLRPAAMRTAFDAVIKYVRTLPMNEEA